MGIPISIASGMNNTAFGDVQGPLAALLQETYDRYKDSEFTLWQKIFCEFNLKTNRATLGEIGGIGLYEDVGENGEYPQTDFSDGFEKTVSAEEWKNSFGVSLTMMEDKLDFAMENIGEELVGAYYLTKNDFFWGMIAAAFNNTDFVTPKGKKISIKTKDGVNLFSTAHKMAHKSGTICNAFSDAFSATALGKASTRMQNMKDDNGHIIGLRPDTIIVPNEESAKSSVFGVVGSYNDPTTPASNKFNYQFGNWNVITVPWLEGCVQGANFPWMLADSTYNKRKRAALDVERIQLNIRSELASNDVNLWKGRGRFGGAFREFRGFLAGGLSFGASL